MLDIGYSILDRGFQSILLYAEDQNLKFGTGWLLAMRYAPCALRNAQPETRNSQLATRNSQPEARNPKP